MPLLAVLHAVNSAWDALQLLKRGAQRASNSSVPPDMPVLAWRMLRYLRCSEALHIKRDHSSYLAEQVALEKKK